MAHKRRTRPRKNPTTAQWAALIGGSVVGLSLLGYGIYRVVKKSPAALATGGFGAAGPGAPAYGWMVAGAPGQHLPVIYQPGGQMMTLPTTATIEQAQQAAFAYIAQQGGVPQAVGGR